MEQGSPRHCARLPPASPGLSKLLRGVLAGTTWVSPSCCAGLLQALLGALPGSCVMLSPGCAGPPSCLRLRQVLLGGLSRCCEALFQALLALFQACANLFQALHWAPQGSECAGLWPVLLRLRKVSHRANRHCSGLAQMLCGSLLGAALGSPRFLRGSPGAARFTVGEVKSWLKINNIQKM